MSEAEALVTALAALWLSAVACLAAAGLLRGARHSILVLLLVHVVFCGVPLWLDLLFGRPEYIVFPGLYRASRDPLTHLIYCLYVSAVPLLWWWVGRARADEPERSGAGSDALDAAAWQSGRVRLAALLGMLAPILAVVSSPEPGSYLSYGAASGRAIDFALSPAAREHYPWVNLATQVGVLSAAVFLASFKRLTLAHIVIAAPFLGFTLWVNGKRHLVAYAVLLVGCVLWRRGVLRGSSLVMAGVTASVAFMGFSAEYQRHLRGHSVQAQGWAEHLESVRVDYGRDDVIKLAIHAELEPETARILDHRGQGLLFHLTMFVPRDWYPDKPYPYTQYLTAAALMVSPQFLGWSVTSSILDEAIANFGWLGLLIGPLVVALVCRIGDATRHATLGAITVLVATQFMTLELVAFAPIFLAWTLATGWVHWKRLSRARGGPRS